MMLKMPYPGHRRKGNDFNTSSSASQESRPTGARNGRQCSDDPTPSGADMRMTRELVDIAKSFGIAIHDHIIVVRDGHASFRELGLI